MSEIKNAVKEMLAKEGIFLCGVLPLSECKITKEYLLRSCGIEEGSVLMFAIPYFSEASLAKERNVSAYAVCKDYHTYVKELYDRIAGRLSMTFPKNKFALFADHSPIDERSAAQACGIGSIGDNGLLITKEYSSYFFLAELITDASLPRDLPTARLCSSCEKCLEACPMQKGQSTECLSAVTQKKGELSDREKAIIKEYGLCWGCDICQEVCPHTKAAIASGTIFSPIPFFKEDNLPTLTSEALNNMDNSEFSKRAYSWRGRETILRNLKLLES